MLRAARGALFLLLLIPAAVSAQGRRAPTDDALEAAKRALNDLRYEDARRLGREVESATAQLRPSQLVALRQLLALAYFPEEVEYQRPDSALRQLTALVRLRPDAELAPDMRWRGLDSLLRIARQRTFAVGFVPVREVVLGGPDGAGELEVATTRPTRLRVYVVERTSGRSVLHDSATVNGLGRLRIRAHDGETALVRSTDYELRLVGVEVGGRDSVRAELPVSAVATALSLQPIPSLDSTRLRPAMEPPDRARTALKGVAFGLATAALGTVLRGGGTLSRNFEADPRAAGVGLAIAIGSIGLAVTEKGRAIPDAVRANEAALRSHGRAVSAAREENARRLSAYRVTLRVAPEGM